MKILLVGGQSSIAKYVKPILQNFAEVITAGRQDCDVHLDLSLDKIQIPSGIDVLVNTAAHFGGEDIDDMTNSLKTNVCGTLRLCEAAYRSNVKRILLISSIFSHLDISSPFYSIYSISKKQSEEAAIFFCSRRSLPLTILRPSQIYGSEDLFRRHHPFFYAIMDKAQMGETIEFYGDNDAKRNFIHIEDISLLVSKCIEYKIVGEFDCINSENVKYSEIANEAIKAFKSPSKIVFLKDKKRIADNVFSFDDSLYEQLGFYPSIRLEEGVRKIATYRSGC